MAMIKKCALAVVLVAAVSSFASNPGSTMSLTLDDGNEVVLQPDSTWDYVKASILGHKQEDIFITLSDNRILWLKADNTWTFTKEQPKANKPKEYPALAVVGTASRGALDIAVGAATEDAFTKAAANLRRHAPASKKDVQKFLVACIKNEVGEHGIETVYNKDKTVWKADSKINLTPQQVFKIMDCLEVQLGQ